MTAAERAALAAEIAATERLTPEQAEYVANATLTELQIYAQVWDAQTYGRLTAGVDPDSAFVVGWDLAARLAGNPAA